MLSEQDYESAAPLFGGDYGQVLGDGKQPGESEAAFWSRACSVGVMCLPVYKIDSQEKLSDDEYVFFVEFIFVDGSRFELGACCGANAAENPAVWQFRYPVKKIDGTWKVMRGPFFVP
jgi:hypothetical protein